MALASHIPREAYACIEGTDAVGCGRMGLDTGTRNGLVPDPLACGTAILVT